MYKVIRFPLPGEPGVSQINPFREVAEVAGVLITCFSETPFYGRLHPLPGISPGYR